MMIFGIEFIWGQHNPARLEFRYATMVTAGHQEGLYVVHDDPRMYGIRVLDHFIGLIRFPQEKTEERRPEPRS